MGVVKIFGLPRTCTNFSTLLLRTNFCCKVLDNYPCWKHGYNTYKGREIINSEVRTRDLKFIICTKHPVDWLWSLFTFENETKLRNKKTSFIFLTKFSWHYNKDIKLNPIEAFNKLNEHWLTMYKDPTILQQFKFENLNKNFEESLKNVEEKFNFRRKKNNFENIENTICPGVKMSEKIFKKKEHNWTDKDLDIIYKNLDKKVVELCGYKLK